MCLTLIRRELLDNLMTFRFLVAMIVTLSLAGTGFTRHVQFLEQVRRYAGEFRTFLTETDRADPESPHALGPKEGTSQKPVRFESIPKFEDRISFGGAYNAAAADILLLLLFFVVLFAGAFLSFIRVDV